MQAAGALCAAVLPEAAGDLIPPFLCLLVGLLLLLPGWIVAFALVPRVLPAGLAPKTEELLSFLAAVVLNGAIFAGFAKAKWRLKLALDFRTWLLLVGAGNAVALAFMCMWFPSAGRNGLFDRPHVQRVVASLVLTLLVIAIAAASLLLRRGFQLASWIVVGVQFVRLLPAAQAMDTWPGGDDGPGMGWLGIVIPFTWILALSGAATCVWFSRRAAHGNR